MPKMDYYLRMILVVHIIKINHCHLYHSSTAGVCFMDWAKETLDVVLTLCFHAYHLLYVAIHFSKSLQCLAPFCKAKDVLETWVVAFGFTETKGEQFYLK